ncbi:unnamed protein product [Lactuca saligna]|uniref:Uncharacterized protein n=1 Tax=Lactuca saligna TaxID=75948 RepID=A0AA35V3Q3_LACSI|nr:unnamed protein product [Lactuca saligna]
MIILILFLISMCVFWFVRARGFKLRPPLPPGPKPLPYIGSIFTMLRNKPTFRWIHSMMDEMNTKIICICLGNVHVVAVSDPQIAREFLKDKDGIFSSRPNCMSGYLTSGGYLTTVLVPMSDHWKMMRKILAIEVLSLHRHNWLKDKRDREADNLLRYIYKQCYTNIKVTGGIVNVRIVAQQYSTNIIRNIMFGSRYFGKGNIDGGPGEEEIEHVDSLLTVLGYLTKEDDLLDVFINIKNPPLTADQIKAQIFELTLATFDNPANGIEWAMAEMINRPNIFNKAVQELDYVVGKDRLVQESDIPKLNYIKSCVKEAFRLHPVSPFNLPHVSSSDTVIAGYFIPKGSHVILSRLGLGRNPDVWEDPMIFNPDRHMKDAKEVLLTDHSLKMLSFSTGRCGCGGVLLGSTVAIMLFARIVHGFTWELPPDEAYVDLNENLTDLMKAKPLLAFAKPRLSHHLYPIY